MNPSYFVTSRKENLLYQQVYGLLMTRTWIRILVMFVVNFLPRAAILNYYDVI